MLESAAVFWILFVCFFLDFSVRLRISCLCIRLILLSLLPLFLLVLLSLLYLLRRVNVLIGFAVRFLDELLAVLLARLLFGIIWRLGPFGLPSAHFFLQHFPLILASTLILAFLVVDQFLDFAVLHSPDFVLLLLFTSSNL